MNPKARETGKKVGGAHIDSVMLNKLNKRHQIMHLEMFSVTNTNSK